MSNNDEKKQPAADNRQQKEASPISQENDVHKDEDQHSYPGKLDKVEGQMHNGEIGGGMRKEEE